MTLAAPSTSWSGGISTGSFDMPVQCRAGFAVISWRSAGAPASTNDGLELGPGDIFVVPAGQTWYHVAARGTQPTLFYEGFA